MKKKIGGVVVADLNHTNYGSFLQTYATLKTVEELGYEINIIRYQKKRKLYETIYLGLLYFLSGGFEWTIRLLKNSIRERFNVSYRLGQEKRRKATNILKEREFVPYFKQYVGFKDLCEGSKEYDACFVGSDQTWRPIGYYSNYWNLLFVDDTVPKFSYAASYGVSKIPWIQKRGTKRYLERIDMISVREQKAKDIVESISNKKAKVVADPTMLRTSEQWADFARNGKYPLPKEDYIFCYFLGTRESIRRESIKLAKEKNMKIVSFRHMDEYIPFEDGFGDYAPYDIDARDFVNVLMHAKYVCTDSFHGTVFSIIMHKQFMTFYRTAPESGVSTHSRIDNLLETFILKNRLYKDNIMDIDHLIDYESVDKILNNYRNESLTFFKEALSLSEQKK